MFRKNSPPPATPTPKPPVSKKDSAKKESIPSVITKDIHILGNIVSEGVVDFDGTLDGNVRCSTLTVRSGGLIKGEVVADAVYVYGKIKGLIRAKTVYLYASCHVEGIVMHETITMEDGSFLDGKLKRTDKVQTEDDNSETPFVLDEETEGTSSPKLLENLRLIR